jgi:hypothetical protein
MQVIPKLCRQDLIIADEPRSEGHCQDDCNVLIEIIIKHYQRQSMIFSDEF